MGFLVSVLAFLSPASARAADTSAARKQLLLVEISKANAALEPAIRKQKYADMAASPLAFYRATAHLFYRDLDAGVIAVPASWATTPQIATWVNGDFHTQNVGFFHNRDGKVIFGLNDFDEAFPAPFYFDLIRFVAAIHLNSGLTHGWNLGPNEAEAIAQDAFLSEYQTALESLRGGSAASIPSLDADTVTGPLRDKLLELTTKHDTAKLLKKWTVVGGSGARGFDFKNPDLVALTAEDVSELAAGWPSYLASLEGFSRDKPEGYFTIKDRAVRLNSGLGSRGLRKYYLILEGPMRDGSDDLIVEVKESRRPAMLDTVLRTAASTYATWFAGNHGKRSLIAHQASLGRGRCDAHFGFMSGALRSYVVRPISPWKYSYAPNDFGGKAEFTSFAKWSARALAYAHASADRDFNPTYVSHSAAAGIVGAIKAWPHAKPTLVALGRDYAAQVRADFDRFRKLRAEGSL